MDPSSDTANTAQTSPNEPTGPASSSRSRTERFGAWVAANGLYVETALAVIAIGVGIVSVPFVTFGVFTAIEGETTILTVGSVIAAVAFVSLGTLSSLLVFHARVEVRRHGVSFTDSRGVISTVYTMARAVETLLAVTVLTSVLSVVVAAIAVGSVPDLLPALVGFSAVLLPVVVIAHGCGATARYVLDLE
ncbi:hypothetical protein [Halorubrum tebenquichense]|uniref:Uncharacterized protein n=1 Tax=Halorubrum tebenquichense DSM 14210 TaxID=1227485 RepID=M0E1K3_9EURY|nr:hypothetical protein [Halorubrum tebenquichense]ELZ41641.1 hypothetical protein C472_00873 [Halorubrum tebenquichense DSM 14210]